MRPRVAPRDLPVRKGAARGASEGFRWVGARVGVIRNGRSGRSEGAQLGGRLERAVEALGAAVVRHGAEDIGGQIGALRGSDATVVAAIGGDGTVNAGARCAMEMGVPLLVVPAGTMDLVARDLCVPVEFDGLIEALPGMVETRVDVAAVNGELFLHSSVLGVVPRLARIRERMRSARGAGAWGRWMAEVGRFARTVARAPDLHVELESERGGSRRRTKSIAVTCNPLVEEPAVGEEALPVIGRVGRSAVAPCYRRATMTGGVLGVYASAHRGPGATARVVWSLARGRVGRDAEIDYGECTRLVVRTRRRMVTVCNDGELVEARSPLVYAIEPRGLRVLVPGAGGG